MINAVMYDLYKALGKMLKRYPGNMNVLFTKKGAKIGKRARIFSNILTSESFLITVGDDTTLASNVHLITHDASVGKFIPDKTDLFGEIIIGSNCFIGAHSVLLYGCVIPDCCIVAAGSVVTKKFTEKGKIIAGNPAHVIGDVEKFIEKSRRYAVNRKDFSNADQLKRALYESEFLVKR